jgi:predicted Zn-ribbon and HTH transcriptional regulator
MTPVKRVRVTAFDCVCARCGRKWRALEKPTRCPGCDARNWSESPRPYRRKGRAPK